MRLFAAPLALAGLLCLLFAPPAAAQQPAAPEPEASAAPEPDAPAAKAPDVLDLPTLEAFLDGLFASQMKSRDIPGACLAVVRDGKTVLLKGYGFADLDKRTPVDPSRTLFRVGSVSKLLVWTALMQLVDQGRLNLQADVNTYLKDFAIPPAFSKPVTMAALMTHTPGFEDRGIGLTARQAGDLKPLGQVLRATMPARVFAPGTVPAYSNWGTALAGHILAEMAGAPFEEVIESRIFAPLGMERSTFRQPLPEALAADMATGYAGPPRNPKAGTFELIQLSPAGSMSATAKDMAAFLAAHLQNGGAGSGRILSEAAARDMHARHFGADPRISGIGRGFYEWLSAPTRVVLHEGDTELFHTLFALVPEEDLGVYMSFNGPGGAEARREILRALLDRLRPGHQAEAKPGDGRQAQDLEGWYEPTRAPFTTVDAVLRLLSQMRVRPGENGTLTISGFRSDKAPRLTQAAPGLYRRTDTGDGAAFFTGPDGARTFVMDAAPTVAFTRVSTWGSLPVQAGLVLGCLFVVVSAAVLWLVVVLARLGEQLWRPFVPAKAAWPAVGAGFVLLGFFVGFAALLFRGDLSSGLTLNARLLLVLPWVAVLLALPMLGMFLSSWLELLSMRDRAWGFFGRLHYGLVLAATVGLLLFVFQWRLFRLPFAS